MKFRPVAVPLITVDPFFSVWSCSDALYGTPTQHWSGKLCPIVAGVIADGRFYSVSGFDDDGKAIASRVFQRSVEITPTSSIYRFENAKVKLEVTFMTPLLLDRVDILSRPVSYISYRIEKKEGCREANFLFGISIM